MYRKIYIHNIYIKNTKYLPSLAVEENTLAGEVFYHKYGKPLRAMYLLVLLFSFLKSFQRRSTAFYKDYEGFSGNKINLHSQAYQITYAWCSVSLSLLANCPSINLAGIHSKTRCIL